MGIDALKELNAVVDLANRELLMQLWAYMDGITCTNAVTVITAARHRYAAIKAKEKLTFPPWPLQAAEIAQ